MQPLGRYTRPALIAVGLVAALAVYLNRDVHTSPASGPRVPGSEGSGGGSTGKPAPILKEAGPAELALVAPLEKGGKLLDYDLRAISSVDDGVLWLILVKGDAVVYLTVAMASDAGARAPIVVGPYAIFYSGFHASEDASVRLGNALAEIVKANASAPTPPGLATYTPGQMPAPPK